MPARTKKTEQKLYGNEAMVVAGGKRSVPVQEEQRPNTRSRIDAFPEIAADEETPTAALLSGLMHSMHAHKNDQGIDARFDSNYEMQQRVIQGHIIRYYNQGRAAFQEQVNLWTKLYKREAEDGDEFVTAISNLKILWEEVIAIENNLDALLKQHNFDFTTTNFKTKQYMSYLQIRGYSKVTVAVDSSDLNKPGFEKLFDLPLETPYTPAEEGIGAMYKYVTEDMQAFLKRNHKKYMKVQAPMLRWHILFSKATASEVGNDPLPTHAAFCLDVWLGSHYDDYYLKHTFTSADFEVKPSDDGPAPDDMNYFLPFAVEEGSREIVNQNGRTSAAILSDNNQIEGGEAYGANWQQNLLEKKMNAWKLPMFRWIRKVAGYTNLEERTLLSADMTEQDRQAMADVSTKRRAAEEIFKADMQMIKAVVERFVSGGDFENTGNSDGPFAIVKNGTTEKVLQNATDKATMLLQGGAQGRSDLQTYLAAGEIYSDVQHALERVDRIELTTVQEWAKGEMKKANSKYELKIKEIRLNKDEHNPSWATSAEMGGFVEFSPALYWAVSELPVWTRRCGCPSIDADCIDRVIRQTPDAEKTEGGTTGRLEERHTLLASMVGELLNFRNAKNPRNYVAPTTQAQVHESRLKNALMGAMYQWYRIRPTNSVPARKFLESRQDLGNRGLLSISDGSLDVNCVPM